MTVALTTITREQEQAVWEALWDRGYDSYDLVEALAERALQDLPSAESVADAVRYAERCYGVRPRGTWCPECREGGTSSDWNPERCEYCGVWLEVA